MKRKDYVYGMKPYGWFKGSVLTFFGILISRWGIGWGRVTINMCYGLPIYFLVAASGMLVTLILKIEESQTERNESVINKLFISSASLYVVSLVTSIFHTVYYNLEILNMFLLILFGIIYFLVFYYRTRVKLNLTANILISLSISLGLLYGASLNGAFISILILVLFGAVFLLQFSKDLINESKNKERYNDVGAINLAQSLGDDRTRKISAILDIFVIVLIILPIVLGIGSILFYSIFMLITVVILGIAATLTLLKKGERKYYKTTKSLLKLGMFLFFGLLLFVSF